MNQQLLFGSALVLALTVAASAGTSADQVAAAPNPATPVKTPAIPKAPVMWPNPQLWRGGLHLGPHLAPPPFIPTRPGLDPSRMAIVSSGAHLTAPGYAALLDPELSFLMTDPFRYRNFEERLLFGRHSFMDPAAGLGAFDILRMIAPEIYPSFDQDLALFLGRDPYFSRPLNRYSPVLGLGGHPHRPSSLTTLLGLPSHGAPFLPGRLADPFGLDPLLMTGMHDFMPWTARRSLNMVGIPPIPGFNGGLGPGLDPTMHLMNRGLIGGLRYGSPLDGLFLPGQGMGIPGFPMPRRSIYPFGNPYPIYPTPVYRTPVGGTQRPAPPPAPSEEQRAFLREFQNELTRIETLAQKKSWPELEKPVQEVLGLPELPARLSDALKAVRSGAEQLQCLERLRTVVRDGAKDADADTVERLLERLRAADPDLTQKMQDRLNGAAVPGDLAAEVDGHIQALELDVRVRLADIGQYRDRAGKLAAGDPPRKQPEGNPVDKVAELLGRSPTPVERLLILRMQADRQTPEEMARILKEAN